MITVQYFCTVLRIIMSAFVLSVCLIILTNLQIFCRDQFGAGSSMRLVRLKSRGPDRLVQQKFSTTLGLKFLEIKKLRFLQVARSTFQASGPAGILPLFNKL